MAGCSVPNRPALAPSYACHFQDEQKPIMAPPDLVWGKVRSHPWWPGLILEPSLASPLALQHRIKGRVLVAYFADKTFAWSDPSALRPYRSHFSKLHRHSAAGQFALAVDDSVLEVSRRVELALSCSCIELEGSKEWGFENSGVRARAAAPVGDASFVRKQFVPEHLVSYLIELACAPMSRLDRLDLQIAKAQLKAFEHLRGYPAAPQFNYSYGWGEEDEVLPKVNELGSGDEESSDAGRIGCVPGDKSRLSKEKAAELVKQTNEVGVSSSEDESDCDDKILSGKLKTSGKRMATTSRKSVNNEDDLRAFSGKKQKSDGSNILPRLATDLGKGKTLRSGLKESMVEHQPKVKEKTLSELLDGDTLSQRKGLQRISAQKRKISELDSVLFVRGLERKSLNLSEVTEDWAKLPPSPIVQAHYKIGECMLRAVGRLSQSSVVKADGAAARESPKKVKVMRDSSSEETSSGKPMAEDVPSTSSYSGSLPKELLLQLKLAAGHPLNGYEFAPAVIDFFTMFRQHVISKCTNHDLALFVKDMIEERYQEESLCSKLDSGGDDHSFGNVTDEQERTCQEDGFKSTRKIRTRGNQGSQNAEQSEAHMITREPESVMNSSRSAAQSREDTEDKAALVEECRDETSADKVVDEMSMTSLILNFSGVDAIPSESDLMRIFNQFGPLWEAGTEISKSAGRVQVFFQRRADARAAFATAGKITELGPSLISYRLNSVSSAERDNQSPF